MSADIQLEVVLVAVYWAMMAFTAARLFVLFVAAPPAGTISDESVQIHAGEAGAQGQAVPLADIRPRTTVAVGSGGSSPARAAAIARPSPVITR